MTAQQPSSTTSPNSRLRILVLGNIIRQPVGSATWPGLQYALGLQRLGHDVYFFEDSGDQPACFDPSRQVTDADPTFGLLYAGKVFDRVGLRSRWAYHDALQNKWHGPCADKALELCRTADLLINLGGHHPLRPWLEEVPRRAFVDTNPGFEQVRQHQDAERRALAAKHTAFFTLGENIAAGTASHIPDLGITWMATRQPVVLNLWAVTPPPATAAFTTLMEWESDQTRQYDGVTLGMKADAFVPYLDLPRRAGAPLELAVSGPAVPLAELKAAKWKVVDPLGPTTDPWTYQVYLRQSLGELAVAREGYVVTRSGWFSERSAHYLATGRPVVTQDTGFDDTLPTGDGLFAFRSPDEALGAIEAVLADPLGHGTAARELAAEFFNSDAILTDLLSRT